MTPINPLNSPDLAAAIAERARRDASTGDPPVAVHLVDDQGNESQLTAVALHEEAAAWAAHFDRLGLQPDDVVLLVLNHSRALVTAFIGALYHGALPSVHTFWHPRLDRAYFVEQIRQTVRDAQARVLIARPEFRDELARLLADLNCHVITAEELPPHDNATSWPRPHPPEKAAFIQFSSGTTGGRKGAVINHRSILNNIDSLRRALSLRAEDVFISWLPLHHDMGLIAKFLLPLVYGLPAVLLAPGFWIRDPKSLLWAVHNFQGTITFMPNFAYNLCLRGIHERDLEGLDLGSWRVTINGAETVRADTIERFTERFVAYGYRPEAMTPAYGLAENTLAVSIYETEREPIVDWIDRPALQAEQRAAITDPGAPDAVSYVACGRTVPDTELIITGDDGRPLPDRHEGEILIRSNALFAGYYNRPDLLAEAMHGDWFRTGDMGYLVDGQLYITGRKKDLIIVGGRNIYPQDVEEIANEVPGVYPGRTAAFGIADAHTGSEKIVLVAELRRPLPPDEQDAIRRTLRQRVAARLGVPLGDIRLLEKQRWVVKTSSGKTARPANRAKYLAEFGGS